MNGGKIVHEVLYVSHVAEEVFGRFGCGPYDSCWGRRRASKSVFNTANLSSRMWWRGMAGKESGHEQVEEYNDERENHKKVRVQADKSVDSEKG